MAVTTKKVNGKGGRLISVEKKNNFGQLSNLIVRELLL